MTLCYPSLYQINTRAWLRELARTLGRPATLDDIPDAELKRLAEMGFDWVWFLSVWQTGQAARAVSLSNPEWRAEFQATLPDLTDDDICGSGFAITGYTVHTALGGNAAMKRLRKRLNALGLRLLLDFVPNHTAPDHPWATEHPDYYVEGAELQLAQEPQNYTRAPNGDILAYGRDPYFSGWPDTLQLNYANPALQEAMIGELLKIADLCDGARCDMAMLALPDVFERTWGLQAEPFWQKATDRVRSKHPDFLFMAEVYWDLEWTMQQQGFNYAYDKRLYDRLREGHARPVREHFHAGLDYQDKLARFLENHDEPRAAATFEPSMHKAAAIITFFAPGLRFFHQGQFEGRQKRLSPHLCRWPQEQSDAQLKEFYARVLAALKSPALRDGEWQLLECIPAWEGNWTSDCFIAYAWRGHDGKRILVAVNFAPNQSQCRVRLPFGELAGKQWQLRDQIGSALYERAGDELVGQGLYVDLPPWGYHVFEFALPEQAQAAPKKIQTAAVKKSPGKTTAKPQANKTARK